MGQAMDPKGLSPLALAFVGDGVFELLVRERLLDSGTLPVEKLHRMAVEKVCAKAQAASYDAVAGALSEAELHILKRGRNAATSRVPKSCTAEEYHKATALETLFGYLHLKGERERLRELFAIVEGAETRE